jgi:hypothetical protein
MTQANAIHIALHTIAEEINTYPTGRERTNMAGIKMKATTRNATVVVYPVPVDFWWASNIGTPTLLGWPKRRGIRPPDLVSDDPRVGWSAQTFTIIS